MKEILDFTWKIINSSIFGIIIGFILANYYKVNGKVDIIYVPDSEEFPKDQFRGDMEKPDDIFIVDIINNKDINIVINNMKIKRGDKEYKMFEKSSRGIETDPINIEPHTGKRLTLTIMDKIEIGDILKIPVNGKIKEVSIHKF